MEIQRTGSTTQGRGIVDVVGTGGRRRNSGTVIYRHRNNRLSERRSLNPTPSGTVVRSTAHYVWGTVRRICANGSLRYFGTHSKASKLIAECGEGEVCGNRIRNE